MELSGREKKMRRNYKVRSRRCAIKGQSRARRLGGSAGENQRKGVRIPSIVWLQQRVAGGEARRRRERGGRFGWGWRRYSRGVVGKRKGKVGLSGTLGRGGRRQTRRDSDSRSEGRRVGEKHGKEEEEKEGERGKTRGEGGYRVGSAGTTVEEEEEEKDSERREAGCRHREERHTGTAEGRRRRRR